LRFHDGIVKISSGGTMETGQPPTGTEIVLLGAVYGDVDRDGADETVAEFVCLIEGGSKQLVAFDRDSAGHLVTLGRVVATTGEIRDIRTGGTRISGNGIVTVPVGDFQRCCDDRTPQVWQDRGYRRENGRFEQVSGPTRMSANAYITETSVTAGELVLGPAVDGYRYGTLTVTVRNGWGTRPAHIVLEFGTSGGLERTGSAWPPVTAPAQATSFPVTLAPPVAGGTVRYTFAFRAPVAAAGARVELGVSGTNAKRAALAEANPWNNGTVARVRITD
jgi:hypothetical protein